jgi:hypothetical protein
MNSINTMLKKNLDGCKFRWKNQTSKSETQIKTANLQIFASIFIISVLVVSIHLINEFMNTQAFYKETANTNRFIKKL